MPSFRENINDGKYIIKDDCPIKPVSPRLSSTTPEYNECEEYQEKTVKYNLDIQEYNKKIEKRRKLVKEKEVEFKKDLLDDMIKKEHQQKYSGIIDEIYAYVNNEFGSGGYMSIAYQFEALMGIFDECVKICEGSNKHDKIRYQ